MQYNDWRNYYIIAFTFSATSQVWISFVFLCRLSHKRHLVSYLYFKITMPCHSHEDFITAFRRGDYLKFIEWLPFLVEKYQAKNFEAGQLIALVEFHWLNIGFTIEDTYHLIILSALLEQESCPFKGQSVYNATILISAALQCRVYALANLSDFYFTRENFSGKEILMFMDREMDCWNGFKNSEQLRVQDKQVREMARDYQKEIFSALQNLSIVCWQRELLVNYTSFLEENFKQNYDDLMAVRLGLVKGFLKEYTLPSQEKLEKLVLGLENQGMPQEEATYLAELVPKPLLQKMQEFFWKKIMSLQEGDLKKIEEPSAGISIKKP